jgi:hypothetical protein
MHSTCHIGAASGYYPDAPTAAEAASIRGHLARQWACIAGEWACKAAGQPWDPRNAWDPDRPPEPILAILEGPLAWRRIPLLSAFDPDGFAACLDVWHRPDGLYFTLSPEGAARLGVRPVGLTSKRRSEATFADRHRVPGQRNSGEDDSFPGGDAAGNILSGETALMDGRWMAMVRIGDSVPLFRWGRDYDNEEWIADLQTFDGQEFASLDAIGPDNIPDECCQAEKDKVFTRPVKVDPVTEAMKAQAAAG